MIDEKYNELTEWMFEQVPMFQNEGAGAYKPGLERVLALSEAFGNPHLALKCVHVAGTNGKGSTSSLIASSLQESGLKTGLFTSPHLIDFRERIRIDGQMISKAEVVDFIERYRAMNLPIEPSFFELTTVMAFEWFAKQKVDVAVIEVGLGGRLDSTNIITPAVSVITNISLDHTALLGHTPAEIAREKGGIIKSGIPVVIGHAEGDVRKVFAEIAKERGAEIIFAEDSPIKTPTCPLTGDCQLENTNTAMHALRLLNVNKNTIERGFANVLENSGLMGRWMVVGQNPTVVCDTGHNPGGWDFLGPRLKKIADEGTLRMVIGFVNDKDINTILAMMPRNAKYYFCSPSVKRGRPAAELEAEAARHGLTGRVFDTVDEAFAAAKADASATDTIFVGGSTFVVADLLKTLKS